MLRKFLLPALAAATLAGCATGYGYRGGNGDYYYGRPTVEYRHLAPYGYYGGYYGGGYGLYGSYGYGSPYYYAPYYYSPYGYRPRPHHGGHDHDGDHDGDHHDGGSAGSDERLPPWRNPGRLAELRQQRLQQQQPEARIQRAPAPMRIERPARSAPSMPIRREAGSRMGGMIQAAKARQAVE